MRGEGGELVESEEGVCEGEERRRATVESVLNSGNGSAAAGNLSALCSTAVCPRSYLGGLVCHYLAEFSLPLTLGACLRSQVILAGFSKALTTSFPKSTTLFRNWWNFGV
jgi:hypothetical protein